MEGHCSTGQSPQWAVVPMEEGEEGGGEGEEKGGEEEEGGGGGGVEEEEAVRTADIQFLPSHSQGSGFKPDSYIF